MEFKAVKINKPDDTNVIIGQSHFIKTVEDLYEALIGAVPGIKFGLGFCESSGECLVRVDGNDDELKKAAVENALTIGAGHCFVIILRNAYPINILNAIKNVQEVCNIYCASANPVEVILAETEQGRAVLGIVDGLKPKGVETEDGIKWRKGFLRKIGYKLT
ncbi:MAG: adenosine-specific kinase [Candidatus Omnitrophica bacterium]|nr:adenosine-specific kinase [Candidatus Omnitrophota bacterium]